MVIHLENARKIPKQPNINKQIADINRWFSTEYVRRKALIEIAKFYNYTPVDTLADLYNEAYDKENQLRKLLNLEALPEKKLKDIF